MYDPGGHLVTGSGPRVADATTAAGLASGSIATVASEDGLVAVAPINADGRTVAVVRAAESEDVSRPERAPDVARHGRARHGRDRRCDRPRRDPRPPARSARPPPARRRPAGSATATSASRSSRPAWSRSTRPAPRSRRRPDGWRASSTASGRSRRTPPISCGPPSPACGPSWRRSSATPAATRPLSRSATPCSRSTGSRPR